MAALAAAGYQESRIRLLLLFLCRPRHAFAMALRRMGNRNESFAALARQYRAVVPALVVGRVTHSAARDAFGFGSGGCRLRAAERQAERHEHDDADVKMMLETLSHFQNPIMIEILISRLKYGSGMPQVSFDNAEIISL